MTKQFVTDSTVCSTNYNRVLGQVQNIWAIPPNFTSADKLAAYSLYSYRIGDYMAVLLIGKPGVRGSSPLLIFHETTGQFYGLVDLAY